MKITIAIEFVKPPADSDYAWHSYFARWPVLAWKDQTFKRRLVWRQTIERRHDFSRWVYRIPDGFAADTAAIAASVKAQNKHLKEQRRLEEKQRAERAKRRRLKRKRRL